MTHAPNSKMHSMKLNNASKYTLFGAGCIGSIVLFQFISQRINLQKAAKPMKLSKREIEGKFRAEITKITRGITANQHANNAITRPSDRSSRSDAVLFDVDLFGSILEYFSSFEYLHTICRISKWHYVFLHHNAEHEKVRKQITCSMLWRESCFSWNRSQIGVYFNNPDPSTMDIFKFMHFVGSNWKISGCSKDLEHDRHSEIIQQMICIPYIVPNIHIVQHWFRYISNKTRIPIKELCFKSKAEANPNPNIGKIGKLRNRKRLKHHFVSSVESPYELHLFIWITIYNLYQMHSEIVRKTNLSNGYQSNQSSWEWAKQRSEHRVHRGTGTVDGSECSKTRSTTKQSGIRLNNFGFEHELQKWLVNEHDFHFVNWETITLLKLYNMMMFERVGSNPNNSAFHVIFMLSICMKIMLHNTELHIIKLRKQHTATYREEAVRIRDIFLDNLGAVVAFTQYISRRVELGGEDASYQTFKQLLESLRVMAMVENMLKWFSRLNNSAVFYLCKENALVRDMDQEYLALFGLKCQFYPKESAMRHYIAVWV